MAAESVWAAPLRWNEEAVLTGEHQRVFCLSMGDVFEARTELDAPRSRLWKLIEATPNLTWQLLTKRPQNIASMVPWSEEWPRNIWLGTTVENQLFAEHRIPRILEHRARIHFVSCEPLLGPLTFAQFMKGERRIGWLVAGGESGPAARPTLPQWFRALRDECVRHNVKFFLKQVGRWAPNGGGELVKLRSKKDAGRLLDGREWNEVPDLAPTAFSIDGGRLVASQVQQFAEHRRDKNVG